MLVEDRNDTKVLAAMPCDDVEEELGCAIKLFAIFLTHHRDQPLRWAM